MVNESLVGGNKTEVFDNNLTRAKTRVLCFTSADNREENLTFATSIKRWNSGRKKILMHSIVVACDTESWPKILKIFINPDH